MLALVVAFNRVLIPEALEAGVRQALVVVAPADALVLEQVDDSGNVLVHKDETVAVQTERIATAWSNVIRLAGNTNSVLVSEQDALVNESLAIG